MLARRPELLATSLMVFTLTAPEELPALNCGLRDLLHSPGRMRHTAVDVGTPGNRCRWRKRSDQRKRDRQARIQDRATRDLRAFRERYGR